MLAAGCLIAACGSSKSSTSASASTSTTSSTSGTASSKRAQLVACLRQHGVPFSPRRTGTGTGPAPGGGPPGGGGGRFFGGGGGLRNNPKLAAAIRACGGNNLRFRGRPGGFRISRAAITNYVSCVRKHGYPQMPNPNFSGKGSVFPSNIRSNAKFQAASRDCQSLLRPAGAPNVPRGAPNTTANS